MYEFECVLRIERAPSRPLEETLISDDVSLIYLIIQLVLYLCEQNEAH